MAGKPNIGSGTTATSTGEGGQGQIEVVSGSEQQYNQFGNLDAGTLADSIDRKLERAFSAESVEHELSSFSNSPRCSIIRVPEKLRNVNISAYIPEIISVGPFHCDMPGNEHKLRYVRDFLYRVSPDVKLKECVKAVGDIALEARTCYPADDQRIISSTPAEFVELMVIDGLFILELLYKVTASKVRAVYDYDQQALVGITGAGIIRDDPFLINRRKLASLARDMILPENQIPSCVLNVLHKFIVPPKSLSAVAAAGKDLPSLWEIALMFFIPLMELMTVDDVQNEPKHFLDLLHSQLMSESMGRSYRPPINTRDPRWVRSSTWKLVPNVKELRLAGIKFKIGSWDCRSFVDIRFHYGTLSACCLEMPRISIQDGTETLLRNLIAYEQTVLSAADHHHRTLASESACVGKFVASSYAMLMDSLVNSLEDVQHLIQQGIITSKLDNNAKVLQLFRKLTCEVVLDRDMDNYYASLCDDINRIYTQRWRVRRATVKRDILNDWRTIITFFLGVVLTLFLSFLQTLFSILSYHDAHKKKKKVTASKPSYI